MNRSKILVSLLALCQTGSSMDYPIQSKTLVNGLKVIVCEKNTNSMVHIEVVYRVGSKDEWDGVRGMAHLFEHMMFRGSKKFNGENLPFKVIEKLGGGMNAYTTFDRTVYEEELPGAKIETLIELEADRMANLILSQNLLNTEREVVGEELRLGENTWDRRLDAERYKSLYPKDHPYQVDVIGNLNEVTAFTTQQCQEFYDRFYSPNNAFVIVTGNVKSADVFMYCEKYFGEVKKQLPSFAKKIEPDIFTHTPAIDQMTLDFPVQIYSYVVPSPAFGHKDFYGFNLLSELLFSNSNSILQKALVNANLAYAISGSQDPNRLYSKYTVFDVVMQAGIGNAKVKKVIGHELNEVIQEGIDSTEIIICLGFMETKNKFNDYSNEAICEKLGFAEYYYHDYTKYNLPMEEYKKITSSDFKRLAQTYFNPESLKVINVKPKEAE